MIQLSLILLNLIIPMLLNPFVDDTMTITTTIPPRLSMMQQQPLPIATATYMDE